MYIVTPKGSDFNQRTQEDRKCTYNLTFRHVRAAMVAVEKQHVLHNMSVCF